MKHWKPKRRSIYCLANERVSCGPIYYFGRHNNGNHIYKMMKLNEKINKINVAGGHRPKQYIKVFDVLSASTIRLCTTFCMRSIGWYQNQRNQKYFNENTSATLIVVLPHHWY